MLHIQPLKGIRDGSACRVVPYLCKYTILSVVLLQDVLEGKLDLLLEFLHLHLLLEPGSIWKVNGYNFSLLYEHTAGPVTVNLAHVESNDAVPLI